jgi:hypothetical protein
VLSALEGSESRVEPDLYQCRVREGRSVEFEFEHLAPSAASRMEQTQA